LPARLAASFRAKHARWIDATRSASWQKSSECPDEHQQYWSADERERVHRPDAIQQ